VYEGEFANNLYEGIGKITFPDGGFYHGYFQEGKRNGEGLVFYASKDRYSGQWKNGLKHGNGTYIIEKISSKIKGKWEDGKIMEGEWVLSNGDVYKGAFKNQYPCGEGTWILKKGVEKKGVYTQIERTEESKTFPKIKSEFYNEILPKIDLDWVEI